MRTYGCDASRITADQIRLLTLSHDVNTDKRTFRLDTYDRSSLALEYVAISYAWEDEAPTSEIQLGDGSEIALSHTLACLIEALQTRHERIAVWIDALCINQTDKVEKGEQVRGIADVYDNAKQVIIWLGPAGKEVELAWQYLLWTSHLEWPDGWETEENRAGLGSLFAILEKSWFRRLWIIQEAVLGGDVVFMCGSLEPVAFSHLMHCVHAIWRYCPSITEEEWDHPAQKSLRCFSRLLTIRKVYLRRGEVPYELLLQAARFCELTDPRDKVFGLQGVATACENVPLPDYRVPLRDVANILPSLHTRILRALLCHGKSLDSLALAGLADQSPGVALPSWVVNLEGVEDGEPLTMADAGEWDAGGPVRIQVQEVSPGVLEMGSKIIDELVQCWPPFDFDDVDALHKCMEDIMSLDLVQTQSSSRSTDIEQPSLWRHRILRSLLFGLDIDDEPIAAENYAECFNEWLLMLASPEIRADADQLHQNVFHRTAYTRINGWRACLTKKGELCLGPAVLGMGDCVCVVPGCRLPVVLRGREGNERAHCGQERCFELVSWCYVDGWMHGQHSSAGEEVEESLLY